MAFDLSHYDDFDITSAEKRAMMQLSENKDFDVLCTVFLRWLVWRSHQMASNPIGTDADNVALVALQGANGSFKQLIKFVYGEGK